MRRVILSLAVYVFATAVPGDAQPSDACFNRMRQVSKAIQMDSSDVLALAVQLDTEREMDAASALASTVAEANLVADRVSDDLFLLEIFSGRPQCAKEHALASRFVGSAMKMASHDLKAHTDRTIRDVARSTNATLAQMASKAREHIRELLRLIEECGPPQPN